MNTFCEKCKPQIDISVRCSKAANQVYKKLFGKDINIRRFKAEENATIDNEFGVDVVITDGKNPAVSIQEKFRLHKYLRFGDLSLAEYENGDGSFGEWFCGIAQYEFFAWEDDLEDGDLEDWLLIDLIKLRKVVNDMGGIEKVGLFRENKRFGKASFYCLTREFLKENGCIVCGLAVQNKAYSFDKQNELKRGRT